MLSLTAVLLVAAAAGEGGAIKIGTHLPLSGYAASIGQAESRGLHLAADEINAAGGVLGRQVALIDGDDEGRPEKGAQLVRDLIDKEHVVALLGPHNTVVANETARIANERRIPMIIPGATGNKVNELFAEFPQNYVFRIAPSEALQTEMMATEAFVARGYTKAAVIYDDTPFGKGGRASLERLMAKQELKPVYAGSFKIGEADMTPKLRDARTAGAEVTLFYGLAPDAINLVRALEKLRWRPPVMGPWNLCNPVFLSKAGSFADGTLMPQTFIEERATEPEQLKFIGAYRKRYSSPHVEMAPAVAQSYDAVQLLAIAMRQAGTTDGPKVKAALEGLKGTYQGATGTYFLPWRPDDHEAITRGAVVWGTVKSGKVVPY
jgi:branched-chain amino acid transport system substrate-binding protein